MKVYLFCAYVLFCTLSLLGMQKVQKQPKKQLKRQKVQLDDASVHYLKLCEIESSELLLSKKLLRNNITLELVKKWGHSKKEYKQLNNSPLFVHNINTSSFNLVLKALRITSSEFKSYFQHLSVQQQEELLDASSSKKLGVAQLIAQMSSCILLPEIINYYIAPHFLTKIIVDHMRNNIIIDNAGKKKFTQKIEQLPGKDVQLRYNLTSEEFMMIPTTLIKKNKCMFDGTVGRITIELEDQTWTRIMEYKTNNGIRYIITPGITDEACARQAVKRFSDDSCILWTIDDADSGKIFYKKNIALDGGRFRHIIFSPNGSFFATAFFTQKSLGIIENFFSLTTLGRNIPKDYQEITFPMDHAVTALCFNPQSTVLAVGSWGFEGDNTIALWNTHKGTLLSSLSGHQNFVNIIRFNHSGTKMLSISQAQGVANLNILKIILWDTADYANIKQIMKNHLVGEGIADCQFNPDDTKIVMRMKNADLIIFDGITGELKKHFEHSFIGCFSSAFSNNGRFLVSAQLSKATDCKDNTMLYDVQNGILLGTLVTKQENVRGAGFTHDKRHVVTVTSTGRPDEHTIITTTLFDEKTNKALKWLKKESLLAQQYALYRLYKQANNSSKKFFLSMIDDKSQNSEKIKELIKKGLC